MKNLVLRAYFLSSCLLALLVFNVSAGDVQTGLDVMVGDDFEALRGKRVGLILNHSSIDRQGRHMLDLMHEHPDVEVVRLFTPEHGLRGTSDEKVTDGRDEATGLEVVSLYGKTRKPPQEKLEDVDALVFDIQDIGARFYTYISTMGLAMEAAKEANIEIHVLDRPNPIGGHWFDGPIQDDDLYGKFTAFRFMPTAHGMTVGELAKLFNEKSGKMWDGDGIGADLHIAEVEGWERGQFFDETGLPWVNPSPNMRSLQEEILYTMVALTEANKDISVGRGTDRPFEYLGAVWLDGPAFVRNMRAREIPGLWVMDATFMVYETDISGRKNYPYPHKNEYSSGARFVVSNRHSFSPVEAGIHMLDALIEVGGEKYSIERLRGLVGAQWILDALKEGMEPAEIAERWRGEDAFTAFAEARESVLLYD